MKKRFTSDKVIDSLAHILLPRKCDYQLLLSHRRTSFAEGGVQPGATVSGGSVGVGGNPVISVWVVQ